MIFGPRPCSSTSAATDAPATVGAPSVTLSPPTTSTSPNWMISPGSPLTLATCSTSSAATRYCLPPVLMTANIVLSSCSFPVLGSFRTGFFQSVWGSAAPNGPQQSARSHGPALPAAVMAAGPGPVKEVENHEFCPPRVRAAGRADRPGCCRPGPALSGAPGHAGGPVPGRRLHRLAVASPGPEA